MAVSARILLWIVFPYFTQYQLGNCGDSCKYVTIPVCGGDAATAANSVVESLNQESNKRCQAGTPGKKGPIGPRGYKGERGPRGQPGSDAQSITEDRVKQLLAVVLEERQNQAMQRTGGDHCASASEGIHRYSGELFACDGHGWTIIQKRVDGSVDFERTWVEYRMGFGSMDGNFWLGLDRMHGLVYGKSCRLRIELETFGGEKGFANYSYFSIGDEGRKYVLTVDGYKGTIGDGLFDHNGMKFTTTDHDNDMNPKNCAGGHGGWWYKSCFTVSPNAPWGESEGNWNNIVWHPYKKLREKMAKTAMLVKCDQSEE